MSSGSITPATAETSGARSPTPDPPPIGIDRVRARDPEALAEVVHRYLPQVLRTAGSAGLGETEAEEVAQETFRTFVESLDRFEGRSSVRTWLFGILYRKIHEARRRLGRDRRIESLEASVEESVAGRDALFESRFRPDGRWARRPRSPGDELDRKELRREVLRCLESSPTPQRMAFVLREIEGLDAEEICEILGISRSNLGVMLHRLRHRTRTCLEAKGVTA